MSPDSLEKVSSVLPLLVLVILLVAFAILFFLFIVLRRSRKVEAPPIKADPVKPSSKTRPAAFADSFAQAARTLRNTVSGRDYRYQVPWFVMLGVPGAGPSAVLDQAGETLIGGQGGEDFGHRGGLLWRFFDRGVVIETPGDMLLSDDADDSSLRAFLRLLQRYRPRRPVDGIILAVPCEDFMGSSMSQIEVRARAGRVADKLQRMQKMIGMSLPVYLLITRCDEIRGFQAFTQEIPAASQADIFGWSNPYHPDSVFRAVWVDEAFDSIESDLDRLESEIFVGRPDVRDPDGLYLFPAEFDRLREPTRLFLEQLFRETAYRESYHLRGVYFCGGASYSEAPLACAEPAPANAALDPSDAWMTAFDETARVSRPRQLTAPTTRAPVFVRNLLEKKIFPEAALARPFSGVYMTRNRLALGAQIASVVAALILGLGLLSNTSLLAKNAARLTPILHNIDEDVHAVRQTGHARHGVPAIVPKPLAHSEIKARGFNLMDQFAKLGPMRLRYPFLPDSWFVPMDNRVSIAFVPAFEDCVLVAMELTLEDKTHEIVAGAKRATQDEEEFDTESANQNEAPADSAVATDAVLRSPEPVDQLPEFQDAQRYVNNLELLRENIQLYNGVTSRGVLDVGGFRKLWTYLYADYNLPDIENNYFKVALQRAQGPNFTMTGVEDAATSRMDQLVNRVYEAWFRRNFILDYAGDLETRLKSLEAQRIRDLSSLRELLGTMSSTEKLLRSPGMEWLAAGQFRFEGPLGRITEEPINTQENVVLLNPELRDRERQRGQSALEDLQNDLRGRSTKLTGKLFDSDRTRFQLSEGVNSLKIPLENLLNLSFMARSPGGTARTDLDTSTSLTWRLPPLQDAMRMHEDFTRFVDEGLLSSPASVRATFRSIALHQLEASMLDAVGQAEVFAPRARGPADITIEELAPEVKSFKDAVEPIRATAAALGDAGSPRWENKLLGLTTMQAENLLRLIDLKLTQEEAYAVKDGTFAWWKGQPRIALLAYEAHSPDELTQYLGSERDQIRTLADNADPLVRFLGTRLSGAADPYSRLVLKWQRILAAFKDYDAKKPGNSLTSLEDFITVEMDKTRPETSCQADVPAGRALDFFSLTRNELRRSLHERCQQLAYLGIHAVYAGIADQFNATLAGKFPFAAPGERGAPQADAAAIASFYQTLDRDGKAAADQLKKTGRFGASRGMALNFLDQVEKVRPMVLPQPAPDGTSDAAPAFDFTPRFRVNQTGEVNGNQIADWTLEVGGQIFRRGEPEHPGRWRYGMPMRLTLRWAKDSPYAPVPDTRQPDLRVSNRAAIFESTDSWALLAFLRRHESAPADAARPEDFSPAILRFSLKTAKDINWAPVGAAAASETKVFLQLTVSAPGAKNPLKLQPFPMRAPVLELDSTDN